MPVAVAQLTAEVLSLPESERARLAKTILRSLGPVEESVDEAWKIEVGRRLARVCHGAAQGRLVDKVLESATRTP